MDLQTIFCPNLDCPARGRAGRGNIGIHSCGERRYICHQCPRTFTETKGTPLYRLRSDRNVITLVLTLLAYGCPLHAIVVAFQLDERTVSAWQRRAGLLPPRRDRRRTLLLQVHRQLGNWLRGAAIQEPVAENLIDHF